MGVAAPPGKAPAALVESLGLGESHRVWAELASYAPAVGAAVCPSEDFGDLAGKL